MKTYFRWLLVNRIRDHISSESLLYLLLQKWRRRWFQLRCGAMPGQYILQYYVDNNTRRLKGSIDLDQCEQVRQDNHCQLWFSIKYHLSLSGWLWSHIWVWQDQVSVHVHHQHTQESLLLGSRDWGRDEHLGGPGVQSVWPPQLWSGSAGVCQWSGDDWGGHCSTCDLTTSPARVWSLHAPVRVFHWWPAHSVQEQEDLRSVWEHQHLRHHAAQLQGNTDQQHVWGVIHCWRWQRVPAQQSSSCCERPQCSAVTADSLLSCSSCSWQTSQTCQPEKPSVKPLHHQQQW